MTYIPNTNDDRKKMLSAMGASSMEDLLSGIPSNLRFSRPLNIPKLSEMELLSEIESLSAMNSENMACFAGGGVYDHFIPSAVGAVLSRPEFMTSYTPYQPEVAQGTLQVIYEFQSHICRITGMDAANASLYDGASAAAEAVLLAMRATDRDKIVLSETVNPLYREVIHTYLSGRSVEIVTVPMKDGCTDFNRLADVIDEKTACLVVAQPNFFGLLEEAENAVELIHKVGGKLIMSIDPISQMLLKTPGDYGADIVVGEGQPLGISLSYGGPLVGFFAARKELIRSMPGRIVARTTDVDGKDGFVLTLQTREQHIRREKATSNICTNQALCATAATIYMTLLGKTGLKKVALLSAERAQSAAQAIYDLPGFEPYFRGAFVREFAVKTPKPAREIIESLTSRGILAGVDAGRWFPSLSNCLIVACTEKRTTQEISLLTEGLREYAQSGVMSRM
jgi:glycine dehydrogenase subunit 1